MSDEDISDIRVIREFSRLGDFKSTLRISGMINNSRLKVLSDLEQKLSFPTIELKRNFGDWRFLLPFISPLGGLIGSVLGGFISSKQIQNKCESLYSELMDWQVEYYRSKGENLFSNIYLGPEELKHKFDRVLLNQELGDEEREIFRKRANNLLADVENLGQEVEEFSTYISTFKGSIISAIIWTMVNLSASVIDLTGNLDKEYNLKREEIGYNVELIRQSVDEGLEGSVFDNYFLNNIRLPLTNLAEIYYSDDKIKIPEVIIKYSPISFDKSETVTSGIYEGVIRKTENKSYTINVRFDTPIIRSEDADLRSLAEETLDSYLEFMRENPQIIK